MNATITSDVPFQHMPKEALKLHRLRAAIRLGVISLIGLAALVFQASLVDFLPDQQLTLQALITFLGIAAFIIWLVAWPPASWKKRCWRLTPSALELHSGVVFQHEHHVPRSRVQHTEVTQGPLQRKFKLATLIVYTAGERFADTAIAGLDVEVARGVRDELLKPRADDVV